MRTNLRVLISDFVRSLEVEIAETSRRRALAVLRGANPQYPSISRYKTPAAVPAAVWQRRRLQGQYLGHLRALRGAERRRVQRMAQHQGVKAALDLAQRLRAG